MSRKIIHVDMDCFYAAIEERENPDLRGKPVGVGGRSMRGVLTTANYEARKYGCRSAMPVFKAVELCPDLVLVPVRFDLYREESAHIRSIFERFTSLIEPLSLDEAFLDVSHLPETGAEIAEEIRAQIRDERGLAASAGIAPNKMLAKIASDWNKPDGQFEVKPANVAGFMINLPVRRIPGVGKKGAEALAQLGIQTCGDLQKLEEYELAKRFGKWGRSLYQRCRGRDHREVEVEHVRKSIGRETTFRENRESLQDLEADLPSLIAQVTQTYGSKYETRRIKSLVVKLKFADFERTTAERATGTIDEDIFTELLQIAWHRGEGRPVRLLGVSLKLADEEEAAQLELGL
ncbi:MAG: DNA polymerase IV [Verrucomicrobiota bacterium JB023]|nr:DNA polymerase IV [Verrucomicrobiota bacterium JB023]